MRILLVEQNDSYRQQLTLNLENILPDCEIVFALELARAREILSPPEGNPQSFDIIIIGNQTGPAATEAFVADYKSLKSCLILATEKDLPRLSALSSKSVAVGAPPKDLESLKDLLRAVVNPRVFMQKSGREILDENYSRVRISFFWRFNHTDCDIYLRLSAHKFVKIIHGGDYYDKDIIEKYANKKQSHLYISKADFERFGSRLGSMPFLGLIDTEGSTLTTEAMVRQTHALLQDLVTSVGISESAVKMSNMYCDFVVNTTVKKSNRGLLDLFKNFRERKDYLYDHSYLLSCLCAFISKELQWHTSETIEKLCYAALFHDITLKDPDLAMITDLESSEIGRFSPEEVLAYHQHPLVAAKMVKDSGGFPLGVEGIIVQHHENVEGKGFPRGLSAAQVSPLVCVFILCHDFISELYRCDFDPHAATEIVHRMEGRYAHGNYVKVFNAFKTIISQALAGLLESAPAI